MMIPSHLFLTFLAFACPGFAFVGPSLPARYRRPSACARPGVRHRSLNKRTPAGGPHGESRSAPQHLSSSSSDDSDASSSTPYQVTIEYCTGCRWGLRSFWMAQELLTTFQDDEALEAVTVIPTPEPGGVFDVKCYKSDNKNNEILLWDRKEKGGFPEMKELKQLLRDLIDPELYLGHSDRADRQDAKAEETAAAPLEKKTVERDENMTTNVSPVGANIKSPGSIVITYCTGCKWLLRAAYMGLELISTFEKEVSSITLVPSRPPAKGGLFTITLDGKVLWDRAEQGGFPPVPELKQLVRDCLAPTKDLGHSDTKREHEETATVVEEMDDEDAEEARRYFGVS